LFRQYKRISTQHYGDDDRAPWQRCRVDVLDAVDLVQELFERRDDLALDLLDRQARRALLRLSRAAFFKRLALLHTQRLELLVALLPRVWWARRAGR
jgi:hypothetical protein